jgi:hypothetical protein
MDGAILVVSALDGPMPVGDPEPPQRLVAEGTAAQASCADANGNENAGLVQVAAGFADTHSGDPVRVVLKALAGQDIDASGIYPLTLVIGEERWTVEARVTLERARRRKRRRR